MRSFLQQKWIRWLLISVVFIGSVAAIIELSLFIESSKQAQILVQNYGYAGVTLIAFVTGLNILIPIPPAAFIPIFVAGGLAMPWVVVYLVIGTTVADMIAYGVGRMGRMYVTSRYPTTYARVRALREKHIHWMPWFVLIYASIVPFPNEAFLVPFGVMGVRWYTFIVPLLVGTVLYHSLTVLGISNVFLYIVDSM